MNAYRLFLDNFRHPSDVAFYIMPCGLKSLYQHPEWTVARSLMEFKSIVLEHGMPSFISFAYELVGIDEWQVGTPEINGVTAARWLCLYAAEKQLTIPPYQVHSVNPVGREHIISVLESYKKSIHPS